MAAQPEPFLSSKSAIIGDTVSSVRTAAVILPLRRLAADTHPISDEASGDRLGPARGLFLGLVLGSTLWLAIGLLAFWMFR